MKIMIDMDGHECYIIADAAQWGRSAPEREFFASVQQCTTEVGEF